MHRPYLRTLFALTVSLMGGATGFAQSAAENEEALALQLNLARKDGIPTTGAELKVLVPHPTPEDNAAPIYAQLSALRPSPRVGDELWRGTFDPTERATNLVESKLDQYKNYLRLLDAANDRPAFWEDREWDHIGTTFGIAPGILRNAADLLLLRGTLATRMGRPEDAVKDFRRALKVADHVDWIPLEYNVLAASSMRSRSLRSLANWAFVHPKDLTYRNELASQMDPASKLDFQRMHLTALVSIFSTINDTQTAEGVENAGLDPKLFKSYQAFDEVFQIAQSDSLSRLKIATGARRLYRSSAMPLDQVTIDHAKSELLTGLLSHRAALVLTSFLYEDENWETTRNNSLQDRITEYRIFLSALKSGSIPRTFGAQTYKSLAVGKPYVYKYDGKQMSILAGPKNGLVMPPPAPRPFVLTPAMKAAMKSR